MTRNVLTLALAMGLIAVSGCNQNDQSADAAKERGRGQGSR